MDDRKDLFDPRIEELLKAFERVRCEVHELSRRHGERTRNSHRRDRQVLIERRRKPR